LEERGNLEIETKTALARPYGGNLYGATAMELEYGTRAWWTTELYLDGQATAQDSTLFTGFRLENRIRPLMRDHAINPVFYVEYENTSGADKTILEVTGHDGHKRPSLHSERLRSASDGDIEWFLRQGDLGHGMPSWSSLPQAQRWQVIAYLRSIQ
jgi:hypothetical protein